MTITITELRKNLFQVVQRALDGELVEVTYRDQTLRLLPTRKQSRLSKAVKRDTLNVSSDKLPAAIRQMKEEHLKAWNKSWS